MTKDNTAAGESEELGFLCHCGKAFTVKQKRTYVRHLKTIHKDSDPDVGEPEMLRFKGKANNRTAEKVGPPQADNEADQKGGAPSEVPMQQKEQQSNKDEGNTSKDTPQKLTGVYQDPETPIKNFSDYLVGKKFAVPPEVDEDTGESDDEEWIEDGCHPISIYTSQFELEILRREYSREDILKLRWIRETFKPATMCPFTMCSAEKCEEEEEDPAGPFRTWARMARHLIEDHCLTSPQWNCASPNCKEENFIRRHEAVRHLMSAHRMTAKTSRKAVVDGEKVKRIFITNAEPGNRDVPPAVMKQVNNWAKPAETNHQNGTTEKVAEPPTSPAGKRQIPVTKSAPQPSPKKRKVTLDQAREEPTEPVVELPEQKQEVSSVKEEAEAVAEKMPEPIEAASVDFVEPLIKDIVIVTEKHYGAVREELARVKSDRAFWEKRCEKAEAGQKELLAKFFQAFHMDQRSWSGDVLDLNIAYDEEDGESLTMNHQSERGLSSPNGLATISEEEMMLG